MEQSKQCVSRELAEKMKELGFVQRSIFYWAEHRDFERQKNGKLKIVYQGLKLGYYPQGEEAFIDTEHYSAFSVAELGEMLPESFTNDEGIEFSLEFWKRDLGPDDKWHIAYWWDEDAIRKSDFYIIKCDADTLIDAMAKMLIYLAEQNLINPKDIKI